VISLFQGSSFDRIVHDLLDQLVFKSQSANFGRFPHDAN
jgi:hypothetical protein